MKRLWFGLICIVFLVGLVARGEGAPWNLITPGQTHYGEVVTRLGHPTVRVTENRVLGDVTTVVHATWEGADAPAGSQRVEMFFDVNDLLPLLIVVVPVSMSRTQVHRDYGAPDATETTAGEALVDRYHLLGLAVIYQPDGQTVRRLEFFEGVRGRYGR